MMARTASSQSTSKGSPVGTMNKPKPHKVGGRISGQNRNTSYGKNLHKLTKITGGENEVQDRPRKSKHQSPSTSPSTAQHVKRNSSTVSLPRNGSKVSMKKNTSNVSLKRNASSTHVNKSRPTTPIRKNNSHGSQLNKLKNKTTAQFVFDAGEEADEEEDLDDEWTEESSSPNITRSNSVSRGNRSHASSPPPQPAEHVRSVAQLPHSPPESPSREDGPEEVTQIINGHMEPQIRSQRLLSSQPNADAITSRILSGGQAAPRLAPELSSVSVNGIPGTQTPPLQNGSSDSTRTPFTPFTPSIPKNGISRFLDAPASSASTGPGTFNSRSHTHFPKYPTTNATSAYSSRAPSPGPESADTVRRAKSVSNLTNQPRTPIITRESSLKSGSEGPETYTFQPPPRIGGNTQAKLNLWKDHERVEPLHGPPPTLMQRAPVGMLGTEERRTRLWEGAEKEMGYLKRFRNPVVEAMSRAYKGAGGGKAGKDKSKSHGQRDKEAFERGLAIRAAVNGNISYRGHPGHGQIGSSHVDGPAENASGGSKRTMESDQTFANGHSHGNGQRPQSHTGQRNVRFEVGNEAQGSERGRSRHSGEADSEGGEGIEELLRRMWSSNEAESVDG
ncbi:hypothetical protein MMC10_003980 [Thelotrema lepadinum]|nr:hypothetical protein [Thelotrema lepadinum]